MSNRLLAVPAAALVVAALAAPASAAGGPKLHPPQVPPPGCLHAPEDVNPQCVGLFLPPQDPDVTPL